MVHQYQGPYTYNQKIVSDWDSTAIGVYYCGYVNNYSGSLKPLYIGKGTGDGGMRVRLFDHLQNENWSDATHFGYCVCDTVKEAEDFEVAEINRCAPKYNQVGKSNRIW